jgi:hypothetical protein
MTDPESAILKIEKAVRPQDLFSNGDSAREYHRLAKLVHPDHVHGKLSKRASAAFAKLSTFWADYTGKAASADPHPILVGSWLVKAPFLKGDISDLYLVERAAATNKKPPVEAILKLVSQSTENDLMEAEVRALKKIHASKLSEADKFQHYFPIVLDDFMAVSGSGESRRAHVMSRSPGLSLADILLHYRDGLDFRHVVWMGNRLLSALAFAHLNGRVHGAVLPEHLLYETENHHLQLVDWCFSRSIGHRLRAVPQGRRSIYPPEVQRKRAVFPATDIYMWALTLRQATNKIPRRFAGFFDWCLTESPNSRPGDAFELKDRWETLAEEEYGPPAFIPLSLPPTH